MISYWALEYRRIRLTVIDRDDRVVDLHEAVRRLLLRGDHLRRRGTVNDRLHGAYTSSWSRAEEPRVVDVLLRAPFVLEGCWLCASRCRWPARQPTTNGTLSARCTQRLGVLALMCSSETMRQSYCNLLHDLMRC